MFKLVVYCPGLLPAQEKQSVKEKTFYDFDSFEVGLRIGEGLCVVVALWVGGCCREEVAAEGGRAAAASDALACTLFFSYSLRLPPNLLPPLSAL